ncbi:MAG: FAD-binding domain-containing protein [Prochlorococcaceae cyanobacterium]
MTTAPLQLVWFKRDLRIADHAPLAQAAERGPVLPLYVIEPELWQQPDASARQWQFCREGLIALRQTLAALGQPLVVRAGSIESVLERAHRHWRLGALWSHQETGNAWTYARDKRVAAWARHAGIPWHESPQFGVIRPLADRNGWARRWDERMSEPLLQAPPRLEPLDGVDPGDIPERVPTLMAEPPGLNLQRGGLSEAQTVLASFLQQRSRRYHSGLSSPLTADQSCSRLSPHLSWGTISMREVVQRTRSRREQLQGSNTAGRWPLALKRFEERLHWHCHFIQKLEDQPSLEFSELHPLTAGLREASDARLGAWCTGTTGLPFVDACMRSLIATGWLNFRMRAMLMSVASYQLWLPWRQSGLHLARLFVDYEPGIHWSQVQMQSGTTGINTIRIYNPIKQALDHDPEGVFVRRWLPELASVPAVYLHQPWTMDAATQQASGCIVGRDYPLPIVDWQQAAAQARDRLWALRQERGFAETADVIQQRHGSRRSGLRPSTQRSRSQRSNRPSDAVGSETDQQLSLDLG